MPVAEYPLPSVSSSNPKPNVWYELPQIKQVGKTEYQDGGIDTALQAGGSGIRRWVLNYEGMTATQAGYIDAHMLTAGLDENGLSAYTFNYRDRDGTLYGSVRYVKYERSAHSKIWNQARHVELAKFP